MIKNPAFLKLLVAREILDQETCRQLIEKYQENAFEILLHLAHATPSRRHELGRLWSDSLNLSYMDLRTTLFQHELVQQLPENFAHTNHIILIYQFGDVATAALANPQAQFIIKEAEQIIGKPISPVFAFPDDIEDAIEIEYKTHNLLSDLSKKVVTESITIEDISELTKDELQKAAGGKIIIEFVHGLMLLAVREGASDIHIEPGEEKVRVRFRIDGILQDRSKLEKSLLAPIVSRLKILADLDITERRRPQDGRINLKLPNRDVDLRFSSIPTIFGEKIVLRILSLSQGRDIPDLTELNFSKSTMEVMKYVLAVPHGIFFVTGPTGSGKTTSLFSMLKYLNKPGINITTIEEPVEYKLPGISQVQVNQAVDLDFSLALRSFLRQDPDVILVGEIRDLETARIACQAALTGHLVLATMHTNSAVQAVTRLMDIGVQPFIVAPSLIGVMCQRLVRKICDQCREKYQASAEEIRQLFIWEGREVHFYRGKGCKYCNNTGYSGRLAIHEIIALDNHLRGLISRSATVTEIQKYAQKSGFQSMRYDGIKKVLRGLTTMDEVHRVTVADEESAQL
ncbi:GspE/PulE family protein [Desulfoferrobacter suflitae]|uniref:GspE/PulE family protein n=1 Tax=Desulfoferrobacter suflitae TaxID=2865782 RepID=UPI0021645CB9|nr:GspE/PulE family protein [Desulfoferrobacter suflitae]MCK8600940.1 GspE/PulE family protein [Desulfoferrobacter suflitae]